MNEDWKSRAEKAEKQLAAIYELALSEDGLANFDAESIRGAWECYCPIDELERVQRQCVAMRREMEWATGEMRGRCPDHWKAAMQSDAGRDLISGKLLMPLIETLKYYANISPVAGGKSRAQVALAHAKSIGLLP